MTKRWRGKKSCAWARIRFWYKLKEALTWWASGRDSHTSVSPWSSTQQVESSHEGLKTKLMTTALEAITSQTRWTRSRQDSTRLKLMPQKLHNQKITTMEKMKNYLKLSRTRSNDFTAKSHKVAMKMTMRIKTLNSIDIICGQTLTDTLSQWTYFLTALSAD